MKMFCLTIFDDHFEKIKKLGYLPVGLGENIKSDKFINDKQKLYFQNPFMANIPSPLVMKMIF